MPPNFLRLAITLLVSAGQLEGQLVPQFLPRIQPEVRVEALIAPQAAVLAGVGANVPAGYFVRLGPSLTAGRVLGDSPATTVRAEFNVRFLADPFHEGRFGAYGGAGIGAIWTEGQRVRAAAVVKVGIDLPGRRGWPPAIELAMGGGVRVGLAFRPARRSGR